MAAERDALRGRTHRVEQELIRKVCTYIRTSVRMYVCVSHCTSSRFHLSTRTCSFPLLPLPFLTPYSPPPAQNKQIDDLLAAGHVSVSYVFEFQAN